LMQDGQCTINIRCHEVSDVCFNGISGGVSPLSFSSKSMLTEHLKCV
jgi:hypothetical protein